MKQSVLFFSLVLLLIQLSVARTLIVDKSGLGSYTSIQAGINAALAGDTVKVFPGVYNEQVNISTDIVVQGSGYEYTQIVANADPALSMSNGKIMWFAISSNTGRGLTMSGGTLTNCVIWNSPDAGVNITGGTTAIIQNCIVANNNSSNHNYGGYYPQIGGNSSTVYTVINTILQAYQTYHISGGSPNILYCRGTVYSGTGNITADPQFVSSTDFRLVGGSPCIDTGKPDIYDPDGSRSDMGYYGGPDAPVFPVVTNLRIYVNPDGTVNVQATAQSRY